MDKVYLSYNHILSGYGSGSALAFQKMAQGETALSQINDPKLLPEACCVSVVDDTLIEAEIRRWSKESDLTRLEKMMIASLNEVINASQLRLNDRAGLIISTTKGNIDVLDPATGFEPERSYLTSLGKRVADHFGIKTEPLVVSNACISGLLSVIIAKRLIDQGAFDHVFITSGDMVTPFILSGFHSFQALSKEPCRPYCETRTGINIGEVAASVLVTKDINILAPESVQILGGASRNDANHISGPSRTGEGLYRSIRATLEQSKVTAVDIDYICAHGTATPYNDEMEAIAFDRIGLQRTPMNSLKGYFGHTLGASGLLETIISMHSFHQNTLLPSKGFQKLGVSKSVNIIEHPTKTTLDTFLKTASGFGGCNAAALFKKVRI